jgi:probable rRNA maturation factor
MQEGPYNEINPHLLGDVVISVETANRQAEEAGLQMSRVLENLLVHGILHLIGYDHEGAEQEALRMEEKERETLHALRAKDMALQPGYGRKEEE